MSSASDQARPAEPADPISSAWTSGAIWVAATAAAAAAVGDGLGHGGRALVDGLRGRPAGRRRSPKSVPAAAVVITGTPKCSDSVVVISGIRAPPPADATATRSADRAPLRSSVSCSTPAKSVSGWRIASSSSLRVRRTSPRCPGSSATSEVAAVVDSRSLAARHCARSRLSGPIADVPDTSTEPASDRPSRTRVSTAWSIRSPDNSVCRTVGPIG